MIVNNLIILADLMEERPTNLAYGGCCVNYNGRLVELTPENADGGLFYEQISRDLYGFLKFQGARVIKTKSRYWQIGLLPCLRESRAGV